MHSAVHYKAYRAPAFSRDERDRTTIVFGGLTWKHERIIQGAAQNLGYRVQPLPGIRRADLETGKALTDVGACCPTTFTTGNLAGFLRGRIAAEGKQTTIDNYVYVDAGSCGPCRFGQYRESYAISPGCGEKAASRCRRADRSRIGCTCRRRFAPATRARAQARRSVNRGRARR
jgi:hypothetical protein